MDAKPEREVGPEFQSLDADSQANKAAYHDLLASIQKRIDPKSNTVLVVDDERAIRRRVARDLSQNAPNLVVVEAGNGREGLDKLEEIRTTHHRDPLFIVLDLNMPIMTGWEVIEALKKDYEAKGQTQGIPIIVLSSTTGESGVLFFRKSVHSGKSGYSPLVSVAKEACIDPTKYDAVGEKGLMAWMRHFLRYS